MPILERVHEHIIAELGQNTRTDTIFILTSIGLNLIVLAINSAVAGNNRDELIPTIIMFLFVSLIIVVNFVVVTGLKKGQETRRKLISGLLKMYKDEGVDGYYDPSLLGNYDLRYDLFVLVVVFTGGIAIVVPLVTRFATR